MSNEIPDEFAAWRRLLRRPDALPEQGLADREASWDKLFERLNERPRRLLFSYRVAAACLLILLIPAARFFQNRPSSAPRLPLAQPVAPLAVTPTLRPPESGSNRPAVVPQAFTPPSGITHPPAGLSPKTYPAHLPSPHRPVNRPIVLQPESPDIARRDIPPPVLTASPAPLVTALSQKPKKQWKVVDLNELDPGHQRPHGMAAGHGPKPIRLGLGIRDAGPGGNTSADRDDGSRLRINLSTENR